VNPGQYLNQFLYGIYPYVAMAVFLVGSLVRFDREQYSWRSESSQLLRHGRMRWGSNLFHVGILGIFFGHFVGLLTPVSVWHAIGVSAPAKQMLAILAGGLFGTLCLAGLALVILRRAGDDRVRATTRRMDWVVLLLILAQLLLGLASLKTSWHHRDGAEMLKLMDWVQHIATFRGGAADLVADAAPVFKAHLALGMTLFVVFPFSRLVHIWSGFGTAGYLFRPRQLVRRRGGSPA
jgi:nitrate reductase gamma subunit